MTEIEFAHRLLAKGQIHEAGPCFFCNAESCEFFKAWLAGADPSGIAHTIPICPAPPPTVPRDRCRRAVGHDGDHESRAGRWK